MTSLVAFALGLATAALPGYENPASAQPAAGDDPLRPKRHFKIQRPADLTKAEALSVYDNFADEMARGYAVSGDQTARQFRKWRRFNTAPYKSATHGNRYVSNYANPSAARTYGNPERGAAMPTGAILAKDSFTVTADTAVFAGALFIMEKLATGIRPATADWRYVMILPDGSFLGDSTGDNADAVTFCHDCHKSVAKNDYLFFVPEAYRARPLGN